MQFLLLVTTEPKEDVTLKRTRPRPVDKSGRGLSCFTSIIESDGRTGPGRSVTLVV